MGLFSKSNEDTKDKDKNVTITLYSKFFYRW